MSALKVIPSMLVAIRSSYPSRNLRRACKSARMNIIQRITDWRHECRIQRLSRELARSYQTCRDDREALWHRYAEAINARSPEQVARMEKKMGLH